MSHQQLEFTAVNSMSTPRSGSSASTQPLRVARIDCPNSRSSALRRMQIIAPSSAPNQRVCCNNKSTQSQADTIPPHFRPFRKDHRILCTVWATGARARQPQRVANISDMVAVPSPTCCAIGAHLVSSSSNVGRSSGERASMLMTVLQVQQNRDGVDWIRMHAKYSLSTALGRNSSRNVCDEGTHVHGTWLRVLQRH